MVHIAWRKQLSTQRECAESPNQAWHCRSALCDSSKLVSLSACFAGVQGTRAHGAMTPSHTNTNSPNSILITDFISGTPHGHWFIWMAAPRKQHALWLSTLVSSLRVYVNCKLREHCLCWWLHVWGTCQGGICWISVREELVWREPRCTHFLTIRDDETQRYTIRQFFSFISSEPLTVYEHRTLLTLPVVVAVVPKSPKPRRASCIWPASVKLRQNIVWACNAANLTFDSLPRARFPARVSSCIRASMHFSMQHTHVVWLHFTHVQWGLVNGKTKKTLITIVIRFWT